MATSSPSKGQAPGPGPKGPRPPTQASSHARAAKARAEQQRKRRNQTLVAVVASVVVLAVVAIIIVVKLTSSSGSSKAASTVVPPNPLADGAALTGLADIPAATLAEAATSKAAAAPNPISGQPPLTSGGLPQIVYVGAEYCPYCAAERWAVVTALSKFGTFTGLGETTSSSSDLDPSTATLSFHGSSYSSSFLVFSPVEQDSNVPSNGGYLPLDPLSPLQNQLITTYDKSPYTGTSSGSSGGIPFIDIGNRWIVSGASYDPAVLKGMNFDQVAQAATDPSSPAGAAIQAAAGQIVSDVCQLTSGQPTAVCGAFSAASSG